MPYKDIAKRRTNQRNWVRQKRAELRAGIDSGTRKRIDGIDSGIDKGIDKADIRPELDADGNEIPEY